MFPEQVFAASLPLSAPAARRRSGDGWRSSTYVRNAMTHPEGGTEVKKCSSAFACCLKAFAAPLFFPALSEKKCQINQTYVR